MPSPLRRKSKPPSSRKGSKGGAAARGSPAKKLLETEIEKIEWIRTGIPGFDDMLEKGIPKGTNILVAGGPGTGKTIFCLQTLYNAALRGHDCLYVTFEESPRRLKQHINEFGWKLKHEKHRGEALDFAVGRKGIGGVFTVKKLDPFKIARTTEALLAKAAGQLKIEIDGLPALIPPMLNPYMIAMDSITALESAFTGKPESYRVYIEQLFRVFERLGATTFLITETEEAPKRFSKTGVEEFLADGVFVVYYLKSGYKRMRGIEVLKLRGAKHTNETIPMSITSKGLEVYPREHFYEIHGG